MNTSDHVCAATVTFIGASDGSGLILLYFCVLEPQQPYNARMLKRFVLKVFGRVSHHRHAWIINISM